MNVVGGSVRRSRLVAVQCRTRLRQGRRCLRDLLVEERDSDRQVDARRLGQSVVEALGEIRGRGRPSLDADGDLDLVFRPDGVLDVVEVGGAPS